MYLSEGIIGIDSHKFTETERNYTMVEKKTLAVMKNLEHFKQILFNSHIQIFTDNINVISHKVLSKRINGGKLYLRNMIMT